MDFAGEEYFKDSAVDFQEKMKSNKWERNFESYPRWDYEFKDKEKVFK